MLILGIQCAIYFIQFSVGATFNLTGEVKVLEGEIARHRGTIGSVSGFASFIMPLLFIAISGFLCMREERGRLWLGVLVGLGVAALVLTFTRAAWVGFAVGLVWLTVVGLKRGMISGRRLIPIGLVMAFSVLALMSKIMMRLDADHESDYDERAALVAMAWNVIEAHPLFGVGAGAYGFVFREYVPPNLSDAWLYVVHNVYLLKWAETGTIGLMGFLFLVGVALWGAVRCTGLEDRALAALALGWSAGLVSVLVLFFWNMPLGFAVDCLFWFMFWFDPGC